MCSIRPPRRARIVDSRACGRAREARRALTLTLTLARARAKINENPRPEVDVYYSTVYDSSISTYSRRTVCGETLSSGEEGDERCDRAIVSLHMEKYTHGVLFNITMERMALGQRK